MDEHATTAAGARFIGQEHLSFAPLFGHQYSHVWIDFRGIQDAYMRERGIDYFENSRRAIYAQRAYAIANPMGWHGYGANVWGITACDGPGDIEHRLSTASTRDFHAYSARGAGGAADARRRHASRRPPRVASIAFAPEIVIPARARDARALRRVHLFGTYGFLDAFNPQLHTTDVPLNARPRRSRASAGSTTTTSASTRARSSR